MEHHLMELLEYRRILGALTTSLDGLLVAAAAVDTADAELIAASAAGYLDHAYHVTASDYGAIHALRGNEMRLIVLAEPGTSEGELRELLERQLVVIEEALRV